MKLRGYRYSYAASWKILISTFTVLPFMAWLCIAPGFALVAVTTNPGGATENAETAETPENTEPAENTETPENAETAQNTESAENTETAATTYLSLDGEIGDWNTFTARLNSMPALRKVDMYGAVLSVTQMEELSESYPNIVFGWTLHIGDHTVRTDATAFSTLHYRDSDPHTSEDFAVLKYCRNLLALDLGHNAITDVRFLEALPKLKILILGRNKLTDITPIGKLTHLEYLELFSDHVKDISALKNCKNLMDVNLTNNHIEDLNPVLSLPKLQRLWLYRSTGVLSGDHFSTEEKRAILSAVPATCEVNLTSSGTGGGWRDHARYNTVFDIFQTGVYRAWD